MVYFLSPSGQMNTEEIPNGFPTQTNLPRT